MTHEHAGHPRITTNFRNVDHVRSGTYGGNTSIRFGLSDIREKAEAVGLIALSEWVEQLSVALPQVQPAAFGLGSLAPVAGSAPCLGDGGPLPATSSCRVCKHGIPAHWLRHGRRRPRHCARAFLALVGGVTSARSAHQAAHRDRARRAGQEAAIFRSVLRSAPTPGFVVDPAVDISSA